MHAHIACIHAIHACIRLHTRITCDARHTRSRLKCTHYMNCFITNTQPTRAYIRRCINDIHARANAIYKCSTSHYIHGLHALPTCTYIALRACVANTHAMNTLIYHITYVHARNISRCMHICIAYITNRHCAHNCIPACVAFIHVFAYINTCPVPTHTLHNIRACTNESHARLHACIQKHTRVHT